MGLDGKKTRLKQADIHKVDFVQDGAQPDAKIMLFKDRDGDSKNTNYFTTILKNAWVYLGTLGESIEHILKTNSSNSQELLQGTVDQFVTTLSEEIPQWFDSTEIQKAGKSISTNNLNKLKDIQQKLLNLIQEGENINPKEASEMFEGSKGEKKEVEVEAKKKKLEEGSMNDMGEKETELEIEVEAEKACGLKKSNLPEDIANYITELESKVEKSANAESVIKSLQETVVKMQEDQQTKEFIAKAASYKHLGIQPEEFGPILKSISKVAPNEIAKIEAILKAADEAVSKSSLFEELGTSTSSTSGTSSNDAWGQIEALADQMVGKDTSTSKARAIDLVLQSEEGKRLYEQYRSGN